MCGKLRLLSAIYIPKISDDICIGCGKCEKVCPIDAISMKAEEGNCKKRPVIDESICLGCGVCARNCPKKAIILNRRSVQVITPVDTTHKFVLQAIETGTLQNLIFDNQAFANHRALAPDDLGYSSEQEWTDSDILRHLNR